MLVVSFFFFSSRRRHTRCLSDWSSDVCSSDLAVKSAAMPDVLVGKDLLQGNGLSQAGGALAQIVGIVFGVALGGLIAAWVGVVFGAAVLIVGAFVAIQMEHVEAAAHETTFAQEAKKILGSIWSGVKEVAGRAPAAIGLSSFQMLRFQFWGFGLFVFALYAKNLVQGGADKADTFRSRCRASAVWSVGRSGSWSPRRSRTRSRRSACCCSPCSCLGVRRSCSGRW